MRALISSGDVSPTSAIDIIRAVGRVGASWDAAEDVVTELAKGVDGIGGTADDLIPPATLDVLITLLHSGVVRDLVGWVASLEAVVTPQPWRKVVMRAVLALVTCGRRSG